MCLNKSPCVPQQISCADTCAWLSVERRQHDATSKGREGKVSGLEVFAQSGWRVPITMNTSVHWSNDRVLRLNCSKTINALNCQHVDYKNRICKADAWNSIANEMGIPRASLEAKIHKSRSQFLRDRKKVQRSKTTGTGADDVYVPLTDERHNVDGCALATCRSDFCQGTLGYKSPNMYRDMCPRGDGPLDADPSIFGGFTKTALVCMFPRPPLLSWTFTAANRLGTPDVGLSRRVDSPAGSCTTSHEEVLSLSV
jgi:hypothetical protein